MSKVHVNIRPYIQPWNGKLRKLASIGCYPVFYMTRKGQALCADCATEVMHEDTGPVDADVNWEDPDLFCDECSQRIESAYAEDEASLPRDV